MAQTQWALPRQAPIKPLPNRRHIPIGAIFIVVCLIAMPVVALTLAGKLPLEVYGVWGIASVWMMLSAHEVSQATLSHAGQTYPKMIVPCLVGLSMLNLACAAYVLNRAFYH